MAQKRKPNEVLSWWEWNWQHFDSYKFRRMAHWDPNVNDAAVPPAIDNVQEVAPVAIDMNEDMDLNAQPGQEPQPVQDNNDIMMD